MKKKKYPRAPKAPKSSTSTAVSGYARRIAEYEKKCDVVKKHNSDIDKLKDAKRKLVERARKAKTK